MAPTPNTARREAMVEILLRRLLKLERRCAMYERAINALERDLYEPTGAREN